MKLEIEKKAVISSFTVPASHKRWIESEAGRLKCSQAEVLRMLVGLHVDIVNNHD